MASLDISFLESRSEAAKHWKGNTADSEIAQMISNAFGVPSKPRQKNHLRAHSNGFSSMWGAMISFLSFQFLC